MKKILIIAGPNGAGKATFAEEFLPNEASCPDFVNADLIEIGASHPPEKLMEDATPYLAGHGKPVAVKPLDDPDLSVMRQL